MWTHRSGAMGLIAVVALCVAALPLAQVQAAPAEARAQRVSPWRWVAQLRSMVGCNHATRRLPSHERRLALVQVSTPTAQRPCAVKQRRPCRPGAPRSCARRGRTLAGERLEERTLLAAVGVLPVVWDAQAAAAPVTDSAVDVAPSETSLRTVREETSLLSDGSARGLQGKPKLRPGSMRSDQAQRCKPPTEPGEGEPGPAPHPVDSLFAALAQIDHQKQTAARLARPAQRQPASTEGVSSGTVQPRRDDTTFWNTVLPAVRPERPATMRSVGKTDLALRDSLFADTAALDELLSEPLGDLDLLSRARSDSERLRPLPRTSASGDDLAAGRRAQRVRSPEAAQPTLRADSDGPWERVPQRFRAAERRGVTEPGQFLGKVDPLHWIQGQRARMRQAKIVVQGAASWRGPVQVHFYAAGLTGEIERFMTVDIAPAAIKPTAAGLEITFDAGEIRDAATGRGALWYEVVTPHRDAAPPQAATLSFGPAD